MLTSQVVTEISSSTSARPVADQRLSSALMWLLQAFGIMHAFVLTETPASAHVIADTMGDAGEQEEQITRNILASWQVQRSMHSEVKKVLEVAKRKKRNERVVRLVDAAARGDVAEVTLAANAALPPCQ